MSVLNSDIGKSMDGLGAILKYLTQKQESPVKGLDIPSFYDRPGTVLVPLGMLKIAVIVSG